jgi:hypothetical protein
MAVRVAAEIDVRVSGFAVNLTAQWFISFPVDVNIKEGKMAVCFVLSSELNVLVDTVQVVKELRQLDCTAGPGDELVIHVAKPAEGLVVCPLQSLFFKVFREEVGVDRE